MNIGPMSAYGPISAQPKPATWQEELAERYIPRAGAPCDRTEHFLLLEVRPPDAQSHFYRFTIQEPDGTSGEYQGLDRTCVFSILRGLERAYRYGAKAGAEWSWLEFLRKVVGSELSAVSAPITSSGLPLGFETPSPSNHPEQPGAESARQQSEDCSTKDLS